MPILNPLPPPPNSQPIAEGKDSSSKQLRLNVNNSWADWFLRLRQTLSGVPVPPPTLGPANSLVGVNAADTDLEYKTLSGTAHEVIVAFAPGSITLSTPQPIDTTSAVTFANVTDSALTAHSLVKTGSGGLLASLGVATNGQIPIGSTGADPVLATLSSGTGISISNGAGSITVANTGVTSVALTMPAQFAVSGSPVTTTGTFGVTWNTESANLVFAGPSSGAAAVPTFRALTSSDLPAGTGTVTSVALSDGSATPIYNISGSPVTTSGTLTFTLATQSSNKVFAGPTSGGSAQPTFRSMVTADVSSIAVTNLQGTTNQVSVSAAVGTSTVSLAGPHNYTSITANSLVLGNGTSPFSALGAATNGQIPIGSTGVAPVLATISAGTGISVTNGAGSITVANTGVTSVALSAPSIFSVSGSPVTTTGTLTFSLQNQNANTFFAGPTSGAASTPTFRTQVLADLPSDIFAFAAAMG